MFTCISDTDVHGLGAKLWTPAWEGIKVIDDVWSTSSRALAKG